MSNVNEQYFVADEFQEKVLKMPLVDFLALARSYFFHTYVRERNKAEYDNMTILNISLSYDIMKLINQMDKFNQISKEKIEKIDFTEIGSSLDLLNNSKEAVEYFEKIFNKASSINADEILKLIFKLIRRIKIAEISEIANPKSINKNIT